MKITTLFLIYLVAALTAKAQWTTSGTHIYNSNSGNVGIGTASPAWQLEVGGVGGMVASGTYAFAGWLDRTLKSYNANNYWGWYAKDGKTHLYDGINDINRISITNDLVGIGTTTPNSALHVFGYNPYLQIEKQGTNYEGGIQFTNGGLPVFYLFDDNGSNALKIKAALLSGETDSTPRMEFPLTSKDIFMALSGGNVGIGTTSPNQRLTVNGTIYGKEVKVDLSVPGPDYVFEKSYALPALEEVKAYIDQNKHLPEVPSAKEMEANGVMLGEMNMLLLKKVEELTLYLIEQDKVNVEMKLAIEKLQARIDHKSKN